MHPKGGFSSELNEGKLLLLGNPKIQHSCMMTKREHCTKGTLEKKKTVKYFNIHLKHEGYMHCLNICEMQKTNSSRMLKFLPKLLYTSLAKLQNT